VSGKRLAPVFVGHDIYRHAAYGSNHPLAIPRVELVMDLCRALGWLAPDEFRASPRASEAELARLHAPQYVTALRRAAESGKVPHEVRSRFALGTMENPVFPGVFERAATSVGGSICAARLALEGRIAYHPAGGTHHGRPDRASGFCYFNDPAFALLTLLDGGVQRLLYVDLDAHHGDAVQDAFAGDARVWTVSLHEAGRWPHTGGPADVGLGRACNLAVPAGFNDSEFAELLEQVILPLAQRIAPQAVVLVCGADALAGDPLSSMALSNVALWSAAQRLAALAPAAVVLGGGGYNPWTVTRYWTGLWGTLSGRAIPAALPEAAQRVLAPLHCDLIDEEDVREAWRTTLADAPNPGPVRDAVLHLRDQALRQAAAHRGAADGPIPSLHESIPIPAFPSTGKAWAAQDAPSTEQTPATQRALP
jgi:acetoin utilization protein AcuC